MDTSKSYTKISAIKQYFEADGGRKVTMEELKALTSQDRTDLATLISQTTGIQISN